MATCSLCFSLPDGSVIENLLANAGDAGGTGLIPGSGRSPEERLATHSSILAWRIPWTEKSGGLQSVGSQRFGHEWAAEHSTHMVSFLNQDLFCLS